MRSRLTLFALVRAFVSAMALMPSTATAQQGAVPVGFPSELETFLAPGCLSLIDTHL